MNRTFDQNIHTGEAYPERDYLLVFFAAILRFLSRPFVRVITTALSIIGVFLVSLGVVGGVETGVLPFAATLPLFGLWVLGAISAHRARR